MDGRFRAFPSSTLRDLGGSLPGGCARSMPSQGGLPLLPVPLRVLYPDLAGYFQGHRHGAASDIDG
jgi:hypothetical protein